MAVTTRTVGGSEVPVVLLGDPASASKWASVIGIGDDLNTSSLYALLAQSASLLKDAGGNFDVARAALGTTSVPAVNTEGTKDTFSHASVAFTPAAVATDFWMLIGSATKNVRLLKIRVTGFATAAASNLIQLIKRDTANSGGTSADPSPLTKHDSNNGAVTAVVRTYSANPTLGNSAGVAEAEYLNLGAAGAAGEIIWDFATRNGQALVLRGVAQSYCLNWNGAAVPAGTVLTITAEWTEEPT